MILAKLNSLRELHSNSCVKSYLFQPNEDEQQKMITKNFASRLVSASVKKRIMLYKEQLREENLIRQRVQADNNSDSGHLVENMKNSESVREPGIQVKSHTHRIDNSQAMRRGSSFFINSLRKSMTFDGIDIILRYQALSWMRNTKAVFEALSTSYKPSITCKYDYRKGQEEIDASAIVSNLVAASSIKVEDPHLIKKKEGINIIMDPTFCSGNSKIGIAITYLKPIDLNNSEEVYRTYPAWSMTNNSFNLQLTQELTVAHSPPVECSLPGWNGRPPIFVPVAKCTIKIIIENEAGVDETTKYKLSNVTFFVWPSANVKAGMKKLNDFCETHFMKVVINAPLQGGLTALSTAALHGNLEVFIAISNSKEDV